MNEKFTKKDILSALGLYTILVVLIVSVCFTAKMLGIPEFQGLFQEHKEENALKKKLILFLCLIGMCSCVTGCSENEYDTVKIWNKSSWVFDNITINTKYGYFYDSNEKFTVDDNTIGVTIYFSTSEEDTWDNKAEQFIYKEVHI